MSRKVLALITAFVVVALLAGAVPTSAQDKVKIVLFVGVGTGTDPQQREPQEKVVAEFNASHDDIELELNIAASNQVAPDVLSTLIASGQAPDIVGPVGFSGSNLYAGQWLDLKPLVEAAGYDLEQFPSSLIDSYRSLDGTALLGLPFAVYPGVFYYNADLFDEAGLNYPPSVAGDPYVMPDGTEVPWDYDTVAKIAPILTVDANGNDATSPDFDPSNIIQFGFIHQWDTIRSDFHTFGAGYVVEDGKVIIHDNWRAEAKWYWDSIWTYHFSPTDSYISSELLNTNAFNSGRVAMARSMAWYTCCLGDLKSNWDLAVQPAYQGTIYAPIDLDTFRIHKDTKHPAEAFTVLLYLLDEGELGLAAAYGALPARAELQDAWVQAKSAQYPSVTHWEVIADSIALAPVPHHEEWYPNYAKGQLRFADFRTLLNSDTGGDIDLDAELDKLQSDLQAIVDEVQ